MTQEHTDATLDLPALVGELLGVPVTGIDEDTHLIQLGLDSLAMMRIAGRCRRAGLDIAFADLISEPTLAAWRRLVDERSQCGEAAVTRPVDDTEPFELALMQHAYWVGRSEGQRLGGVAAHFYHEFDGRDVNPGRLEAAVRAVFARHGMLRVRILDDGRQRILPESTWPGLRVHDLRKLRAAEADHRLGQLRRTLSHRRMDIAAAEVFDVQLSLLADGRTRLHINLDMVAADALSLRVLLADLARAYAGATLPALDYSYPRYLAERRAARETPARKAALEADRAYWHERLPDLPAAPRLPASTGQSAAVTVVRRHLHLDADRTRRFEEAARRHGLTPAMALAAVFAETLQAFSAEPDFLLNLPLFDREPLHDDVASLVGDFTSSVLLAWHGAAPGTFAERAARLQKRFHEDVAHAGYSGVEVLRDASRLHGDRVLAPVVYTSALGLGELFADTVRESFGEASWIISQGPQVWLDAQVTEVGGGLLVNWDAREDAFAQGVLDTMFSAYRTLLERLLDAPRAWTTPVPPMLPDAQRTVRGAVNATDWNPGATRLHDGFFDRAAARPDAPALLWGQDASLTYGELAQRALVLAGHLQARGVQPGDLVAVTLPKGPDQITAVLAVLAVGAAYLPLGVDQPDARRERIHTAAGIRLVLDDIAVPAGTEQLPAPLPGTPDDLAYVIYTSGSTGEPKGVEVTHAAAVNTIADLNDRFATAPSDRTLAVSALDFDLSVYDVFGTLASGGAVVCVEESARRDATAWADLVRTRRVTVVNCVPALLDMLVTAAAGRDGLPTLRLVLLGGDWVPLDLPGRVRAVAPDCRFVALGGTTETAIHSTVCEVDEVPADWESVPYGTPLRGVRCRVVDRLGRDCPDWVPGELWIGGAGVARGYRGDAARTADRFLEAEGLRWYRTGDRARYWPDGTLEFLGRADHQVKIRGHRIELGEVEAALAAVPGVERAVAVVGEDGRLAAAVTGVAEPAQLRAYAAERLPSAMVPERVAVLAELPLTPNGKIDRKVVARRVAQCAEAGARTVTPPRGAREQQVARAWADLLGTGDVGREDDFFTLGGDSLLATRLIARLRADGYGEVRLADLFSHPVLAEFAVRLHTDGMARTSKTVTADPEHRHEPFPLTDVQRAYWLGRGPDFTLGGIGCHFYREYDVVDLDVARLESALNRLVQRHEMLRAVVDDDGEQRILPEVPRLTVEITEAGPDVEAAFAELRERASHQVFDPARWPLFTVRGVRAGHRTRLAIGIDNIALDALSILTFYAELAILYGHTDAELPSADVSFRDYICSTAPDPEAVATARAYWTELLPQLPPAPALPLAKDPATVESPCFTRREARIAPERWQVLTERARVHGLTPSGVLLTAFAEVLGRWSARPDLTLNLTLFDRRDVHPHIGNILGDFTSLMLVSSRPRAGESWSVRARRVQEELWSSLDHRDVSAVWVRRELARRSGEPETTMPVVFTSALGVGGRPPRAPFDQQVWGVSQTPQVWLDHQVTEDGDGVRLNWDVVEELFPDGLVDAMFEAYLRLVDWLATGDWNTPAPELLPAGQHATRAAVNATGPGVPGLLHTGFFRRAADQPQRIALLWGDGERLTYGQLADRALRLATVLVERGVRRGETIAISVPKGPDQIVAVLGVLAAGAAYVPVGVDQPSARRERIHRLSGVRFAVTEPGVQAGGGVTAVPVDAAPSMDVAAAPVDVPAHALAYVIFTSGSTGDPKGVEITHQAAANTVTDINQRYEVTDSDRVLAVSALDFDLSVYDVFGPLSAGGAMVLIGEDERRDARRWLDLVRRHRITVWNTVPALLDMLLVTAESGAQAPDMLRLALVSGDWVGLDLPARLAEQSPWCRFLALGGATEAAIWSNVHEVSEVDPAWKSVPYGRPLRGQRFRVVDAHGRDCPDWVPGELWIGGAGVALGYRSAPELTQRQFVTVGGERWYRTGDLGRYWPDGTLEFLGRADHQVKIRGHRIELGEIEAALRDAPGVGRALVTVAGEGAARRLTATVVPANGSTAAGLTGAQLTSSTVEFRDRARRVESAAAESFLAQLLGLSDVASGLTADEWAARLGAAETHLPVLRLWLRWLAERKVLVDDAGVYAPGPEAPAAPPAAHTDAYSGLISRAHQRLTDRIDDFRYILAGRLDASVLLADDVLAPARLAAADPGSEDAVHEVAQRIRQLADKLRRPVEVAELGGGDGAWAARLLDRLAPEQLRYTLLDGAPDLVEAARQRLARLPHETACHRLPGVLLPDELRHSFDVVLADQMLHRHPDPSHGPALAALLTRRGGMLLAVERAELTPVALLTAALLDGGYAGFDRERRATGTPILSAARWAELLGAAGFHDVRHHVLGDSFTELLQAHRPEDAVDLDPAALRTHAAQHLPAHMVPERIAVLPWLPLGANGKVDRATVTALVSAAQNGEDPDEPPQGELEQALAVMWTELLGVPAVGRRQSFFTLGGDSLLATRFLARVDRHYGIQLPLRRLFAGPTLERVAECLGAELAQLDGTEEGAL